MSSKTWYLVLFLGGIAFASRLVEYYLFLPDFAIYVFFLLIIIAISFGLKQTYEVEKVTQFNMLFKGALRPAAILVVLIALFQVVYFTQINPFYFSESIAVRIEEAKNLNYPEEDIARLKNNLQQIFNPSVIITIQTFGMLFLSMIYGAISVFLFKKFKVFRSV